MCVSANIPLLYITSTRLSSVLVQNYKIEIYFVLLFEG